MMPSKLIFLILVLLSVGVVHAEKIRMPENTPRPIKIGIAVTVNNLLRVNDQLDTLEASINVQWRWKDTNLVFDSVAMGTNRMEFIRDAAEKKLASIWNPELTLANASIQSAESGLFIYADGTVVLIQRVKGAFGTNYRLEAFPFDTQSLAVRIVSKWYNTNQIELIHDQRDINDSGLSKEVKISSWQAKRLTFAMSRTRGWDGQYYPEMQAQIVLARYPFAHLTSILMPFFLVMLVPTIGMFHTRMEIHYRMGYWGSSILALVALSFTFSSRYPMLPPNSFINQLLVIGAGYQTFMIVLTITLLNPKNTERWFSNPYIVPEIVSYLRWAIPLGTIGLVLTRVMLTALVV